MNIPSFPGVAAACVFCLIQAPLPGRADDSHFTDWPEGRSPKLVGTRVIGRFLTKLKSKADSGKKDEIGYPEVITW